MPTLRRAALASAATLAASPAAAHVSAGALSGISLWSYDPWLAIPLYGAGVAFWLGTRNLWSAAGFGRGLTLTRSACYWAAWLLLALAFLSPLHWLSERVFAAHMVEHELLMLIAAPLFAYARPAPVVIWSLPAPWRRRLGKFLRSRGMRGVRRGLASPIPMTVQQALALYLWHIPDMYQWALRSDFAHRLEHITFFVSAYLFWRALLPAGRRDAGGAAIRLGCLFATLLDSGLLGALLTLSPRLLYPQQEQLAADFGLTPLEDQQLAGVVMWIPMSLIYTAAALWLAWEMLQPRRAEGIDEAGLRIPQMGLEIPRGG